MKSFLKSLLWLIAIGCVILVALTCWESKVLPRLLFGEEYRVSVRMRVPLPPKSVADKGAHSTLVRSPSNLILDAALQQPGIAQLECMKHATDKKAWLLDHLEIGYAGSDLNTMEIALTGKDPEEMKKILMAIQQANFDRVAAVDSELNERRIATLKQACENTEKVLTRKKIQFRTLSDQLGAPDASAAKYACIYAMETVATLRNQVIQLRSSIAGLDRKVALLKGRASITDDEDALKKINGEIELARADREVYEAQRETADKALEQAVERLDNLNRGTAEMTDLGGELDRIEKMYRQMSNQLAEWEIESRLSPLVQPASEPVVKRIR